METETAPRRWWAALLWFLLSPAAAYLYLGRPRLALVSVLAPLALAAITIFDPTGWAATQTGYGVLIGGSILLYAAFLIDVLARAVRARAFERRGWSRWWAYLGAALLAWGASIGLGASRELAPRAGVEPFSIPAGSMEPSLRVGDNILVDRSIDPARDLRRGDVIVYREPRAGQIYVKRVIGLPGERIALDGGQVRIDGAPLAQESLGVYAVSRGPKGAADIVEATLMRETGPSGRSWRVLDLENGRFDMTAETALDAEALFVLGDNRDNSVDSRHRPHGPVPLEAVIGRVTFIYFAEDWARIGRSVE